MEGYPVKDGLLLCYMGGRKGGFYANFVSLKHFCDFLKHLF